MCNKLIYLTCLIVVSSMATNASAALVAHWRLDEGSGTIAKDSAGGHDGTLMGDTKWVVGKLGSGALQFDGAGDYVDCGNDPVFNPTAGFSVGFWAYIANWATGWGRCMIGKGGDADRNGWSVRRFSDETLCFTTAGVAGVDMVPAANNYTNMNGTKAPPLNEWVHIACVYDSLNSMTYIYINGVVDAERAATGTVATTDASVYLGTRGNTAGTGTDDWAESFFNGMLDEVRFYNHALTETDVKLIMAGKEALPPTLAANPSPANGATGVPREVTLTWGPGSFVDKHDVYFGTDFNDVSDANVANPHGVLIRQNYETTSYTPASLLDFNKTYYWRVDEVNNLHLDKLWKGNVWSFTVANFTVADDFEGYDDVNNLIYNTWADYAVNNTGMTVGHFNSPFAERSIVHSGRQAMYMHYDNDGTVNEGTDLEKAGTLFYSEAEREWADPQDWTQNGANSLMIWYRGIMASVGSFTVGTPIKMTAVGADIWGTSDQFHFAFKRLSGVGTITARVVSLTNTHASAKAGVMIRETLDAGSKHIMVVAQPNADNGIAFQRRLDTDFASEQVVNMPGMTAPRWVRLSRSGNIFTAYQSSNGMSWSTIGTVTMPMLVDVYVGLCLTSHNANAVCTAEFSSVTNPGTGNWQSQDIGIKSNIAEQLYVVLQDSAGNNSPPVKNSDPLATTLITYTPWNIPFADFAGVNLKAIKKMIIGVGDRNDTQPRSSGDLYIDDIRLYLP